MMINNCRMFNKDEQNTQNGQQERKRDVRKEKPIYDGQTQVGMANELAGKGKEQWGQIEIIGGGSVAVSDAFVTNLVMHSASVLYGLIGYVFLLPFNLKTNKLLTGPIPLILSLFCQYYADLVRLQIEETAFWPSWIRHRYVSKLTLTNYSHIFPNYQQKLREQFYRIIESSIFVPKLIQIMNIICVRPFQKRQSNKSKRVYQVIDQQILFILAFHQSFHYAFVGIEGDPVLSPSLSSRLLSVAKMEPPSIFLGVVVLIDGNGVWSLGLVNLAGHLIIGPSLTGRLHRCAEVEPPPSVCAALVVMELVEGDSIGVLVDGRIECDAVESPPLAKHGIG